MNVAAAVTIAAVGWLSIIISAPLALAHGEVPAVTVAVYHAGSRICHQRPERSFHLAGAQLPVCARCFGLYFAGAMGLVAASRRRRPLSGHTARLLLGLTALPIAASVAFEWAGVIQTSNLQRFLTGVPLGFAAGIVIVRSLTGRDVAL